MYDSKRYPEDSRRFPRDSYPDAPKEEKTELDKYDLAMLEADLKMLQDELGTTTDSEHVFENGTYVRIEPDDMKAWLYLNPPTEEEGNYTREKIVRYLEEAGVFEGYNHSNLSAMIKKKVYNREICAAEGKPMTPGENGYYEYLFDTERHKKPRVCEDGSVDYTSMSELPNVHKGDVIARYHTAIAGEDGVTVRGDIIKTKPGKNLPPLRGKGLSNKLDPDVYITEIDGKAELKHGRVDIQNVYIVNGDVDSVTGKIEFFGDIVITGNVGTGVLIRSGRNITVQGTVEAAELYAGGDVILQRGIQGNQKGKVSARGMVMADFIEHTEVEAGGDLQANIIMNANVRATGKVTVNGKKGSIIGGIVCGNEGVEATTLGNEVEVRTIVHAGYDDATFDKYTAACREEEKIQASLTQLVEEMQGMLIQKRLQGSRMSSDAGKQLMEQNRKKEALIAQLDATRRSRDLLKEVINKGKSAEITVNGKIYRGVIIELCNVRMPMRRTDSFMRYGYANGALTSTVVVYK
ncbi:MAG: FapA family protein [Lachnospiraceae bacterium]|nr:FapA family protein [Lachnospiraceae bacterium]